VAFMLVRRASTFAPFALRVNYGAESSANPHLHPVLMLPRLVVRYQIQDRRNAPLASCQSKRATLPEQDTFM